MPILTERDRIDQKIEQIKQDIGRGVIDLLRQVNRTHLKHRGKISLLPMIDRNNVRWSLTWQEGTMSFALNVVVALKDDGTQALVDRVWVHRHVTTPFDFDGHTPTTRMRRLTGLSLEEIGKAIEAEFRK